MDTGAPDDGLSAFVSAGARLFGIAYRLLGNAAEAEDILQDVWMRWQTTDRRVVVNPPAFLATTAIRLAINVACSPSERAAHVLREAFDDPYRQVADVLRLTESSTRQLVTRARSHVAGGRRVPVTPAEHVTSQGSGSGRPLP